LLLFAKLLIQDKTANGGTKRDYNMGVGICKELDEPFSNSQYEKDNERNLAKGRKR